MNNFNLENWKQPASDEDEVEKLTVILGMREEESLESLAKNTDCWDLFRCAALDRYAQLNEANLENLIQRLSSLEESNDNVRTVANQWQTYLASKKVQICTRGGKPEQRESDNKGKPSRTRGGIPDWRNRLSNDPSPRIRFLATMGD